MDEELTLQWVKGTLIPPLKSDDKEKVLFADNVGFQLSKEFMTYAERKLIQLCICYQPVTQIKCSQLMLAVE